MSITNPEIVMNKQNEQNGQEPAVVVTDEAPVAPVKVTKKKKDEEKRDFLNEDPILKYELSEAMIASRIFQQLYFVVTFATSKNVSSCKVQAFKIRGVYPAIEEANAAAESFRDMDGNKFNVFVGSLGKWTEFDPDPKTIANQVHTDERLNTMMKGYLDNAEKTQKVHQDRMAEVQRRSQQTPRMNKILDSMQEKLAKKTEEKQKNINTERLVPSAPEAIKENIAVPNVEESASVQSIASRRRQKEKLKRVTAESLAKAEEEAAERQKQLVIMREALQQRQMKQKVFSSDVMDIQAAFLEKQAKLAKS
jgi:hypothetical protein